LVMAECSTFRPCRSTSIVSPDMIDSGYLRLLVVSLAIWLGLFLAFTWMGDPYGVSPLHVRLERVNALKPKRFNIDRLIKPYEVWRYQPRTILLGSSRAHQSFDPAVFDSTRFAPAYNAAIPASSVSENAVRLEQFFEIDRNLRIVFVELFFPFFLYPQPQATKKKRGATFFKIAPRCSSASPLFGTLG
jgi:hypothetical protein